MAISLRLIPSALALRTLISNEDFDEWVNSSQIRIPTVFNNEKDVIKTVRMAGYNADYYCGSIKTNLKQEDHCIFWDYIDNQYVAIFSKLFLKEDINFFIEDLERKSGRVIFGDGINPKIEILPGVIYPTNFRDEKMLIKTLDQLGVEWTKNADEDLFFTYNKAVITFYSNGGSTYTMDVKGTSYNLKEIYLYFLDIDNQYKHNVQEETYLLLKDKLCKIGLGISDEIIEEDNSVTLTISFEVD